MFLLIVRSPDGEYKSCNFRAKSAARAAAKVFKQAGCHTRVIDKRKSRYFTGAASHVKSSSSLVGGI